MTKKPLSEYAIRRLRVACGPEPEPSTETNCGAIWRLKDDGLAEELARPSPYAKDKGKPRPFLVGTDAGRDFLRRLDRDR